MLFLLTIIQEDPRAIVGRETFASVAEARSAIYADAADRDLIGGSEGDFYGDVLDWEDARFHQADTGGFIYRLARINPTDRRAT